MVFFTESWFWRGTQSAIFYYISMSPCLEYRHKKKRREEAVRIKKERDEIVMNQPEIRSHWQPAPFNTNPYWAEEIFRGPVSETYIKKKKKKEDKEHKRFEEDIREGKLMFSAKLSKFPKLERWSKNTDADPSHAPTEHKTPGRKASDNKEAGGSAPAAGSSTLQGMTQPPPNTTHLTPPASETTGGLSSTLLGTPSSHLDAENHSSTSSDSSSPSGSPRASIDAPPVRPRHERRLSSAVVNIKEVLKAKLHPADWNAIRYDREDEVLFGLNARLGKFWDRVTSNTPTVEKELDLVELGPPKPRPPIKPEKLIKETYHHHHQSKKRKQVAEQRAARFDTFYSPPVSTLPATRAEAQWMLYPPPSADVMAGRIRPGAEPKRRWPLTQIGTQQHHDWLNAGARDDTLPQIPTHHTRSPRSSTPDLSASSEETWSTDEEEWDLPPDHNMSSDESDANPQRRKKLTIVMPPGWTPIRPPNTFLRQPKANDLESPPLVREQV